ncbi:unnamed protein product [Trichogramma brassicae]|uniref:alpha-glucosidase n=1 Tax=Trichogramma brassicae TaxID=86971 RepID=A0A6H5IID4_9HYME|nr:unnamed protein product [Trichogramma brassicae]
MPTLGKVPLLLLLFLFLGRGTRCASLATADPSPRNANNDDQNADTDDLKDDDEDWRVNTMIYHILPRTFQDSDGNGVGDLQGIISRLNYLNEIGVDTIRLGPVHTSSLADSEGDVSNHTDIDPVLGDFNDFEELIHDAHNRNIKVILDIIPNHSSTKHPWFQSSSNDENSFEDFYLWADGKIKDNVIHPPNNWKNAYSDVEGSAWTFNMDKRRWYYHRFHEDEPDLNLRSEDVIQAIFLSSDDYSRASSRLNPELLDGLYMLTLLLPGQAVTYYGEEIGMVDGDETLNDNTYKTPMQWDDSISAGFSSNETTFLEVNADYKEVNVKKQLDDPDSNLEAYKKLAILRENPIFVHGDYELSTVENTNILILKRSLDNDTCLTIINFGSAKATVNLTEIYPNLEEDLQVMLDSSNADVENVNDDDNDDDIENDAFTLDGNAAAVLCDKDDFKETTETTTIGN